MIVDTEYLDGGQYKTWIDSYVFYFFAGISMHKDFAFVQFTGPFDARSDA